MPTKRSLPKAAAETRDRAKRLAEMGSNGGLFIGAMTGALCAAPRINDWGFLRSFGTVAVCALGGMVLGWLIVGWMIGTAASWEPTDYGDPGGGCDGGGDCGGGDG